MAAVLNEELMVTLSSAFGLLPPVALEEGYE